MVVVAEIVKKRHWPLHGHVVVVVGLAALLFAGAERQAQHKR
jgi:hypothetical protein